MQLVQPSAEMTEREETTVPERRESEKWTSPRIILTLVSVVITAANLFVAVMGLVVVVSGIVFGAYLLSQKNDVTSEMSNVQLAQQIGILSTKFDKLNDSVIANTQTNTRDMVELKGDVDTLRRDLDKEAEARDKRDGWLEARIVSGK